MNEFLENSVDDQIRQWAVYPKTKSVNWNITSKVLLSKRYRHIRR